MTGIWCAAGSPYESTEGALWGIQYARTNQKTFLGTLFQPERRALTGNLHPIVRAFLDAA